jgi:exonuclease III
MDEGMDILVGRPYGGTAILYNKALAGNIKHVFSSNSRITAVLLESNNGNILLINVYMPTNYGDIDSLVSYIDCLCSLQALITEQNVIHVIITGDFNSNQIYCDKGHMATNMYKYAI